MICSATTLHSLGSPEPYLTALDRLHARAVGRGRASLQPRGGVSISRLVHDRDRFARLLSRAVVDGSYEPQPAVRRSIVADKPRDVFTFAIHDLVVHGVIARVLVEASEHILSPRVHSYRTGRSPTSALRQLAAYVRAHRRGHADPRRRGLFVIRADVRAYGESIRVDADSPLWEMVESLFVGHGRDHDRLMALIREAVVPVVSEGEHIGRRQRGIAAGSPVATAICNLYLTPVDRRLEAIEGGFYARFGDDLLLAHPDRETSRRSLGLVRDGLASLGLELHPDKLEHWYFNGAGRRAHGAPEIRGTTHIDYLGARVGFDANIGLPSAKVRLLRADLSRRIRRSATVLTGPLCERGPALCAAINAALEPGTPLSIRYADAVAAWTDDRRQLSDLDRWIATTAAKALTGRKGVRALRTVSPRMLRSWGLLSLEHRRNRRSR